MDDTNQQSKLKILCPFCRQPYSAKMLHELESIDAGCPSCGYGVSATVTVKIICDNCERIVYAKEVEIG